MSVETYTKAWSQLSDRARVELSDLANDTAPTGVPDDLHRELLALIPDAIEWRTWQPASNQRHQIRVDARFLEWVRVEGNRPS